MADLVPRRVSSALTLSVHMENIVLSKYCWSAGSTDFSSATVAPNALGYLIFASGLRAPRRAGRRRAEYCSVTTTGMSSLSATLMTKALHLQSASKPRMTSRNRSWTSHTSTAVVRGSMRFTPRTIAAIVLFCSLKSFPLFWSTDSAAAKLW